MDSRHWRCKNLYLILLLYSFISATFLSSLKLSAQENKIHDNLFPSEIVGIWKKCYHPELKGAFEIDGGYLILNPDGSYIRMTNDYTWDRLQGVESGSYEIKGRSVVFNTKNSLELKERNAKTFTEDGWRSQYELRFEPDVKIAFFDATETPETRNVLRWKDSLNYGFAKIY